MAEYSEIKKEPKLDVDDPSRSIRGCTGEKFNDILSKFDLRNGRRRPDKAGESDELRGKNLNLLLFVDHDEKDQLDKEIEELNAGSSFQPDGLFKERPIYRNEKNFSLLSAPELLASGGSQRLYFHQLAAKEFRPNAAGEHFSSSSNSSFTTTTASSCSSTSKDDDAEIVRNVFSELPAAAAAAAANNNNNNGKKSLRFDVVTIGNRSVQRNHARLFHL